jgi:protein gp37
MPTMADGTHISWTDATWNPITGCSIHSTGCRGCYAMKLAATRLRHHPSRAGLARMVNGNAVWTGEVRLNERWIERPLHWSAPRNIFVNAHGDTFHENVPIKWQTSVFNVMHAASWHLYQVLTKRHDVMLRFCRDRAPLPWVWLGVSVERQKEADERRGALAELAAMGWNTWVSYEPALGPVDWSGWEFLRWLVSGGESGHDARPTHPGWHRAARDFCVARGIPYHMKQWGEWAPHLDRDKDDPDWRAPYSQWGADRSFQFLNLEGGCGFHGDRLHVMRRVGKKAAGALLDGVEWRQMPARQPGGEG